MRTFRLVAMLLAALTALPIHAQGDGRARVTALADRYVAEYQKSFPMSFAFSGLPVTRNDGVEPFAAIDFGKCTARYKVAF